MNIQGLEALATLASAVPAPAVTDPSEAASNTSAVQHEASTTSIQDGSQQIQMNMNQASQPQNSTQNNSQQHVQMMSPQMWQQLMASASGTATNGSQQPNPAMLAGANTLGQMGSFFGNPTNMNLQRLTAQPQINATQATPVAAPVQPPQQQPSLDPTLQALSMALNGMNPALLSSLFATNMTQPTLPSYVPTTALPTALSSPPVATTPVAAVAANTNSGGAGGGSVASVPHHTKIAPQPSPVDTGDDGTDVEHNFENKKLQKRVANRRSAQLSRKRKKQFIEELKDENDYLRRKEQILRSIPDLVVVFDSSGKLWFVSESVNRFLDFGATELEGTSFWNLMCTDSVRLLKAAFMDSLAAREGEASTAPLGQGFWEVRLKNKDGSEKPVSLNGVVHFAGDRPECVCSIRPKHEITAKNKTSGANKINMSSSNNNDAVNSSSKGAYANGKAKAPSRISDSSENGNSDSDERCAAA